MTKPDEHSQQFAEDMERDFKRDLEEDLGMLELEFENSNNCKDLIIFVMAVVIICLGVVMMI